MHTPIHGVLCSKKAIRKQQLLSQSHGSGIKAENEAQQWRRTWSSERSHLLSGLHETGMAEKNTRIKLCHLWETNATREDHVSDLSQS